MILFEGASTREEERVETEGQTESDQRENDEEKENEEGEQQQRGTIEQIQRPVDELRRRNERDVRLQLGKEDDRTLPSGVQTPRLSVIAGHDSQLVGERVVQRTQGRDLTFGVDSEDLFVRRKNRVGDPGVVTEIGVSGRDLEEELFGIEVQRVIGEATVTIERLIELRWRIVLVDDLQFVLQTKCLSGLTVIGDEQNQRFGVLAVLLAIDRVLDDEEKRTFVERLDANPVVALLESIAHLSVQSGVLIGDRDVTEDLPDGCVLSDGETGIVEQRIDEGHGGLRTVVVLIENVNIHGQVVSNGVLSQITHLNRQPVRLFRFVVQRTDQR